MSNPCKYGGCYGNDLTAARLSDNTTNAAVFVTPTASASTSASSSSLSTGAIVGITIGSIIVASVIGLGLFCFYKRHERRRHQQLAAQGQPGPSGTPGIYVPSPYHGKQVKDHLHAGWIARQALTLCTDSNGFPSPPLYSGGGGRGVGGDGGPYTSDKVGEMPGSPGQMSPVRVPASETASWFSRRFSGQNGVSSEAPSVSPLGSSQGGGFHNLHSQQRLPQQSLNAVSEMDGVELARPTWELAGSSPPTGGTSRHLCESGYTNVATTEEHGA